MPLEHILSSLSTRARQNVISDHTDLKSFLELHPNTFDCWKDHEVLQVTFVVKVVKDFPKRNVLKDSSERSNRKITHYELHYPNEKDTAHFAKEGHHLMKGDKITDQNLDKALDITEKTGHGAEMSIATNSKFASAGIDFIDECYALDPDLVELTPLPRVEAWWLCESRVLELSKPSGTGHSTDAKNNNKKKITLSGGPIQSNISHKIVNDQFAQHQDEKSTSVILTGFKNPETTNTDIKEAIRNRFKDLKVHVVYWGMKEVKARKGCAVLYIKASREVIEEINQIIKKEEHFLIKGDMITVQTSIKDLDSTEKTGEPIQSKVSYKVVDNNGYKTLVLKD